MSGWLERIEKDCEKYILQVFIVLEILSMTQKNQSFFKKISQSGTFWF